MRTAQYKHAVCNTAETLESIRERTSWSVNKQAAGPEGESRRLIQMQAIEPEKQAEQLAVPYTS